MMDVIERRKSEEVVVKLRQVEVLMASSQHGPDLLF